MKQGPSNSSKGEGYKTPVTQGVNPGWADQLGQALGRKQAAVPMYDGKQGITCPPSSTIIHKSGSQGRHR